MSPILVRPVREQFEHDRVIRVLQARYKRKYEVVINPGAEQNASVEVGDLAMYPDLVLFSQERSRKMQGTVEVETVESINTLEAMAEWGPFSRLRAAFFLYVPATTIDTVRRLCTEYAIAPAEIWTYHVAIDQVRFTMVHRSPDAPRIPEPRAEKVRAENAEGEKSTPEPRPSLKADAPKTDKTVADKANADRPVAERAAPEKARAVAALKATRAAKPAKVAKAGKAATASKAAPARKAPPAKAKAKSARPAAAAAKGSARSGVKKATKPVAKTAAKKRR